MNEVVLFSSNYDYSTDQVINWLLFYGDNVIRINHEDSKLKKLFNDKSVFEEVRISFGNDTEINLNNINSVWFKGSRLVSYIYNESFVQNKETNFEINDKITNESKVLSEFLNSTLETKKTIGSFKNFGLNKLLTLKKAKKIGINVPDTFILNNKNDLEKVLCSYNNIACKAIYEAIPLTLKNETYLCYTKIINAQNINDIPENFNYSCFQQYIEKKYEIRVFYLNGKFYSMAIFSQENSQTKTDFRQYDNENPNRYTPFQLPIEIENKLSNLFEELELNTGSVDLIYSTNSTFYFLEINPVGQYDFVSKSCNYFLDKKIATYLSYYEK